MGQPDRRAPRKFIADWIDLNVRPDRALDDVGGALARLIEGCLRDAAEAGISPADIEAETGHHVSDLIVTAFLARWMPDIGQGGSAF
jgi:hypothetical protein